MLRQDRQAVVGEEREMPSARPRQALIKPATMREARLRCLLEVGDVHVESAPVVAPRAGTRGRALDVRETFPVGRPIGRPCVREVAVRDAVRVSPIRPRDMEAAGSLERDLTSVG